MGKTVSPSRFKPITPGQMAKLNELLLAALRKSNLPGGPTQKVLEHQGAALVDDFMAAVRSRVDQVVSDEAFARRHPNGTHFQKKGGEWCCQEGFLRANY